MTLCGIKLYRAYALRILLLLSRAIYVALWLHLTDCLNTHSSWNALQHYIRFDSFRIVSCTLLIYLKCDLCIASILYIHAVKHFSTSIPIPPNWNLRVSPTIQCYTIYLPTRYIS